MIPIKYQHAIQGGLIYSTGDTLAAVLLGEAQLSRVCGVLLVGSTLYAVEIPRYFAWIAQHFGPEVRGYTFKRALMAQLYFNPLWIARHMVLLKLVSGQIAQIQWGLLPLAFAAFVHALPLALWVNYSIQNWLPLRWRFGASALFSASMAVYYALSEVLYG